MNEEEILNKCKERFAAHKATLIQDTDRYMIIDWRKADGSIDYYVNYILDKKRGSLIISGDLGDCIATWYNAVSPRQMRSYLKDVHYFTSKFQCSTDKYIYDPDSAFEDIKYQLKDYMKLEPEELLNACRKHLWYSVETEEKLWDAVKSDIDENWFSDTKPHYSTDMTNFLQELYYEYYEWLYDCGSSIDMRVYLWAVGYEMAYTQLECAREKGGKQ